MFIQNINSNSGQAIFDSWANFSTVLFNQMSIGEGDRLKSGVSIMCCPMHEIFRYQLTERL